jgi:predicted nucleic acid-binding protein
MSSVRRCYIYIICAISLQAVTWAIIALLRNLFIFGIDPLAVALQIAVILIGLPVFLAHWLWGQRLAGRAVEERGSTLRRFYLYGILARFLGSFITNAFDLFRRLMGGANTYQSSQYLRLPLGNAVIFHLIALIVLALLWLYHQWVIAEDSKIVPEVGGSATVRRLYILGFSAVGLTLTTMGIIQLIRWVMVSTMALGNIVTSGVSSWQINAAIRCVIGVPLWIIFWRWGQRLFDGESEEERISTLRKFYLYGAVFIGALVAVGNATGILASIIRRLMAFSSAGDGNISQPLPIIIGMAILWIFHAFVLREDGKHISKVPRQAEVRRIYLYLIAAVGLAALLVGLSGDISLILRTLGESLSGGLREEFSWFTAAIIAGLPVWIIPWRQVQVVAVATGSVGADERRSVVRKIYLYFFLFLATVTLLSSAVYIVYRILSMVLGEDPLTLVELGQAISFSLIAIGVWLYHGMALRGDGNLTRQEKAALLEALRVVVLDVGDGRFANAVIERLRRDFPVISLNSNILAKKAAETNETEEGEKTITKQLAEAGLIVGSWEMSVARSDVSQKVTEAVINSPARKLLVPFHTEGWDWAGVDRWDSEAIVNQTVIAVKQILDGEEVKAHRPMSISSVIGIIIGVLLLLILLAIPLLYYFYS